MVKLLYVMTLVLLVGCSSKNDEILTEIKLQNKNLVALTNRLDQMEMSLIRRFQESELSDLDWRSSTLEGRGLNNRETELTNNRINLLLKYASANSETLDKNLALMGDFIKALTGDKAESMKLLQALIKGAEESHKSTRLALDLYKKLIAKLPPRKK